MKESTVKIYLSDDGYLFSTEVSPGKLTRMCGYQCNCSNEKEFRYFESLLSLRGIDLRSPDYPVQGDVFRLKDGNFFVFWEVYQKELRGYWIFYNPIDSVEGCLTMKERFLISFTYKGIGARLNRKEIDKWVGFIELE